MKSAFEQVQALPSRAAARFRRSSFLPAYLFRARATMFGIGHWEILLIVLVIFILFGHRLPSVMRSLGRGVVEFKEGLARQAGRRRGGREEGRVSGVALGFQPRRLCVRSPIVSLAGKMPAPRPSRLHSALVLPCLDSVFKNCSSSASWRFCCSARTCRDVAKQIRRHVPRVPQGARRPEVAGRFHRELQLRTFQAAADRATDYDDYDEVCAPKFEPPTGRAGEKRGRDSGRSRGSGVRRRRHWFLVIGW